MRLSRYAIVSDQNEDGTWILLHGVTGALDVVTNDIVAGLRRYGDFHAAQGGVLSASHLPDPTAFPALTTAEVALLADRGYLTEDSDEHEQEMVASVASVLHDEAAKQPSLLALPTLDCNYRCTYCFERPVQLNLRREGSRHLELELLDIRASHQAGNVVMTPVTVDAMFNAIVAVRDAHGDERDGCQIVLYGGEPLDSANEPVVRYLIEQGRQRRFRFSAITNGHDLEHFIDLFGPGGIEQVQVSIDGPEQIHDKRRIALGSEKSYRKVIGNVNRLLERGDTLVQIRVHLDLNNIDHFEELLGEFGRSGWLDHPNLLIYTNTVYKMTPGQPVSTDIALNEMDQRLRHIAKQHRNLLLNAPSINMRAKWMPALLNGLQVPVQGNYCTANTGQYVFAPDGHIYSCWESVGKADSRIGTYFSDGKADLRLDEMKTAQWFTRHVGLIPECTACPMALVCGGGCAQFALYSTGTQLAPYCDNFDAMFRSGLRDTAAALLHRLSQTVSGRVPQGLVAANYG